MATYLQTNQIVLVPNAAAYAISAIDTGKIFVLPQTTVGVGAIAVTLPAPALGLHYRVINGSAAASVAAVTLAATAAIMHGQLVQGPTNGVSLTAVAGLTTVTFVIASSIKGDYVDLYSDGTLWCIQGASSHAGSMTIA